jgi:serine/threonine protein kinase/tetratricopeptide (TPR) repeat protein
MNVGTVLAGRFEIERLAGVGGMGEVYRARDRQSGGAVAVKLLRRADRSLGERFSREARLLAELDHPAIVKYVAHGSFDLDGLYLIMEWLDGEDLSQRLVRARLSPVETITLITRVAEALALAHARGVVHRDIKPSNLFLPEGRVDLVKVLDFGIARHARALRLTLGGDPISGTGAVIGTPGYMAPEQARGDKNVDARADVFALGCVLFECLVGKQPFDGTSPVAVLAKILLEEAPRLADVAADVPAWLDNLVARMLSKEREGRPADAAEVVHELSTSNATSIGHLREGQPTARWADASPPVLTTDGKRLLSVILVSRGNLLAVTSASDSLKPTMSPDEVHTIDELRLVAAAYRARLEPIFDGTVVVTLVGRGAATDQAAQSARCALAMRALVPGARMSLATGLGVVAERWPVGEVIDRAFRLLRAAVADGDEGLRTDELTARLVDARFDVAVDGERIRVRGEREGAEVARTLLNRPSPCVGRDKELALLAAIFDECVDEPAARAVLVTAPAGIGKSRLRYELVRKLREHKGPVEIWTARGDPLRRDAAFAMLAQAVASTAGLRDGEPLSLRRHKLRTRLGRHLGEPDLTRVLEFLGELAGVPSDEPGVQLRAARHEPHLMGDLMRRAWDDWLTAECAAGPVLIVLDDLHWGDLPSVKVLDESLRKKDRPLMVLGLGRPELVEQFPNLWADREVQSLRLGELGKKASESLVRTMLGDVAPEVAATIVERAAGNAFFLEELIRAEAEGRKNAMPETVLAMVQARIERFEGEARRVLRAASVLGRVFWRGGVNALLGHVGGKASGTAGDWLRALADREVITRVDPGRFPGEEEYVFRHALVREAVYATLTDEDRTRGHRLAGDWLQSVGECSQLVLAEHFERGGDAVRAINNYRIAAVEAIEGQDLSAACALSERAIALGCDGELLGTFRRIQADACWVGGHFEEAERHALEAMSLLARGGIEWYQAAGIMVVLAGFGRHSRLGEVVEALRQEEGGDELTWSHLLAWALTSGMLFVAGQYELGKEFVRRVEARAPQVIAENPVAATWLYYARYAEAMYVTGDPEALLVATRSAVEVLESTGDLGTRAWLGIEQGGAATVIGAIDDAERILRATLAIPNIAPFVRAFGEHRLSRVLACQGKLDEALTLERSAQLVFETQRIPQFVGLGCNYLALLLFAKGELDEAERLASTAGDLLYFAPPFRAYALATLADVRLARNKIGEALDAAREASGIVSAFGILSEGEALARVVLAEALHASGDGDGARAAIAEARSRLEARARSIHSPELRQSFLTQNPDGARTLARAREWLGS